MPTTLEELEDLGEKSDRDNVAKKYMDAVRIRKVRLISYSLSSVVNWPRVLTLSCSITNQIQKICSTINLIYSTTNLSHEFTGYGGRSEGCRALGETEDDAELLNRISWGNTVGLEFVDE